MTTPFIWKGLDLFIKFSWEDSNYPLDWFKGQMQIHPVRNRRRLTIWYFKLSLSFGYTAALVYRTVLLLLNKDTSQNPVVVFVFTLFQLIAFLLNFSFVHTTIFRIDDICSVSNTSAWIEQFWKKSWRLDRPNPIISFHLGPHHYKWDILGLLLILANPVKYIVIALIPFALYLELDPLVILVPKEAPGVVKVMAFIGRVLITEIVALSLWVHVVTYLAFSAIFLSILLSMLTSLDPLDPARSKNGSQTRSEMLEKTILLHSMVYIVVCRANKTLTIILPTLISMGLFIFITCLYATIKLQSVIPMPLYFSMPGMVIIVTFMVAFLFPPAGKIFERSQEYRDKALILATNDKFLRRRLRAVRPVRLEIGQFFFCDDGSNVGYIQALVDNSIDALLTF